jgi:hypothetical protein
MSESFTEIVDSFEDAGQKGIFVQKRDSRIEVLDVFAARKIESGLEALLVQAKPSLLPRIEDWPRSEGFHVNIRPSQDKTGAVLVCLELTAREFREVFLSLAEDVCSVLTRESEPREAIRAMLRRLYRWQEFLRKHRPDGLSEEARIGLFGELEVLRSLFLGVLADSRAVSGWRGCRGANQDFQYSAFALEVKTTRAATPDRIHISNVVQLDEDGIDTMFLYLVLAEQNEAAGVSLPAIVAELRSRLDGHALDLFNEGLVEVGYLDTHEPLYAATLYRVREVWPFSVTGEFPRLRREDIPAGIKGVKYQIGIDACKPYLVEHEVVSTAVRNLKDDSDYE